MPHNRRVNDDVDPGEPERSLPEVELPTVSWGREGYAADEVDEFLDRLRQSVQRVPPTMAPYEVEDERFKVARLGRRYALRAVDDHLDLAKQRLRALHGDDAIAEVRGTAPEPHKVHTGWIYLVALLLVAAMVVFVLTVL